MYSCSPLFLAGPLLVLLACSSSTGDVPDCGALKCDLADRTIHAQATDDCDGAYGWEYKTAKAWHGCLSEANRAATSELRDILITVLGPDEPESNDVEGRIDALSAETPCDIADMLNPGESAAESAFCYAMWERDVAEGIDRFMAISGAPQVLGSRWGKFQFCERTLEDELSNMGDQDASPAYSSYAACTVKEYGNYRIKTIDDLQRSGVPVSDAKTLVDGAFDSISSTSGALCRLLAASGGRDLASASRRQVCVAEQRLAAINLLEDATR